MINVTSSVQSVLHLQPHTLVLTALSIMCGSSFIPQQSGIVDPGVKVNGQYYRDILLMRDLLSDIKQYSDYFTCQQNRAPAHRARETVEVLKVETPEFIPPNLWPPNSPNLYPVDYKIWGILQEQDKQ